MNPPEEAEGYISRAELLIELSRYDEAREELAAALLHHPHNVDALSLLAIVEFQASQPEDALTAADAALALDPADDRALRLRGYALARLGRVEDAVAAAEKLLDVDRLAWWRHMHYALIRASARNGQEALDAAWQAIRLAPDRPEPHAALASIAEMLGLADLAARAKRAAERLGSDTEGNWKASEHLHLYFGRSDPRPAEPLVREPATHITDRLATIVRYGAAFPIAAPLMIALMSGGMAGTARVLAAVFAVLAGTGLILAVRRLPQPIMPVLKSLDGSDRWLEVALACVGASPVVLLCYAAIASPLLLALTMLLGFVGLYAFVMRGR
ncbi:tetratricopeptide repeat protein [Phytomonospora sp. NPDC050363]|uniref:tetratricopeptide repeat protein n=1 Tax=Phytomonospora sp. NPDC050363 TaxID=3155642 RepID=UPI0033FF67DC